MKISFSQGLLALFATFWVGVLFLDYLDKHTVYFLSIEHYKYWGLSFFWLLLGFFITLWSGRTSWLKRKKAPFINGLMIYLLFIVIIWGTASAFNIYLQEEIGLSNYIHLITWSSYTLICSFLVLLGAYASGAFFLKKVLSLEIDGLTRFLVENAIGFFYISLGMFALGWFGLLNQLTVLALLLFFPIILYKRTISFVKKVFWQRIDIPDKWNGWGVGILILTLVYASINFFYTQAPFPLGFDARNYYVNISKLIGDSGSLISGFQPYAWSLVDSIGYIAFFSSEVTLFLATIGGFLACLSIYELGTRYFNLNQNYTLLAVFFFMATPAINNHWIVEFKIDLGLLFIQMTILCLLFHWLTIYKNKGESLLNKRSDWIILGIISILMGFSLSIKVLGIFLTFAIFLVFWLYHKDRLGLIGMACLAFSAMLILGLDDISGMSKYHANPQLTKYIFSVFGVLLMAISFYNNRKSFIQTVFAISFSSLLTLSSFSPWILRNIYNQKGKFNIMSIVLGDTPKIGISLNSILTNYEKKIAKQNPSK